MQLLQTHGLPILTFLKWLLSLGHLLLPVAVVIYAAIEKDWAEWKHVLCFALIYIGVLLALEWALKKRERRYGLERTNSSREAGKAAWEKAHRVLRDLISFGDESSNPKSRNMVKEELSNWMVQSLRRELGAYAEQLEINVFIFSDAECATLSACARAPASPQRSPEVRLQGSLLHWVARTGLTVSVPNTHFSWHPFDLIPEVGETNKSKFLVPLTEHEGGRLFCWGVVSVGASRPFLFRAGSERELADAIMPLTTLLQLIIHKPKFKKEVDSL